MAPFKLIFTSVLVLISVHIMVLDCASCSESRTSCTLCPLSCSCLGTLVDCVRQGLVDVPSDLPVWVEILDLQNNNIMSIDDSSFAALHNLTDINLSHNQLRNLNSSHVQSLGSLQKLTLNHNHLVEFPDVGKQVPLLTHLALVHNEIHSLNAGILEHFPKLSTLDLCYNNLIDLPAATFGNSTALKHLSLSHNRLVDVEEGVLDNLTSLESLKLSKNHLTTLPKNLFGSLSSLQHLELNSNSISVIEGLSFQWLSSLVTLKLRHNSITTLQDGAFYGLSSIKKLQLDNNNIGKVTKGWLYGLNSLQHLYINNNNISEIEDDAWDSGRRLIELDMSHNKLTMIHSKSFDKLFALKRLLLNDNAITYIEEDAFRPLSALQHLELKNNEVSWTVEDTGKVFAGLVRLKYLGLANNQIRSVVRRTFTGLHRLESLNLTRNDITTIEANAFDDMPRLQQLFLNTSSLLCDCHTGWLSQNFTFPITAKCGYPEQLQGLSVFTLPASLKICEGSVRPVLEKEPVTKIALKGQNVTLECRARSTIHIPIHFHWRKDGRALRGHSSRPLSHRQGNWTVSTSLLTLRDVGDNDEGRYQCIVQNTFGAIYSTKARITVHVFPVFTKRPLDVSVRSGSTARLECGARGQPRPAVSWQKDGGTEEFPAAKERRMHVMPTDDVFFITAAKPQDAGLYSCTARNVAGTIVANATLTVLEQPSFVRRMEDKETRAGETAVLECLAQGSPRPSLRWERDGKPLLPTERHFFTAGHQLLIIVHTRLEDTGLYSCNISNSLGAERGHTHLTITQAGGNSGILLGDESQTTTGVIVIAVVICIVGTSIVWVVIIYHTRKSHDYPPKHSHFAHSHSGHSKDSGTVDSGQPSSDDLLSEDDHGLLIESRRPKFAPIPVVPAKEHLPLLPGNSLVIRSFSAEQLEARPVSDGDSSSMERDSGVSTLPRSVSLSNWSSDSPRFLRLPKDVPNDSGSFSIVGEEAQELEKRCRSIAPFLPPV